MRPTVIQPPHPIFVLILFVFFIFSPAAGFATDPLPSDNYLIFDTVAIGENLNQDQEEPRKSKQISPLKASTFLGGGGDDVCFTVVPGPQGSVYVAGHTGSPTFPTTAGAYDRSHNGSADMFIVRLNEDYTVLEAGTFFGGNNNELGAMLWVTPDALYIAGATQSTNLPTTPGAFDDSHNGHHDLFVARFDLDLTTLEACTYLGGNAREKMEECIVLDAQGNLFLFGNTLSPDYPVTSGAYDETYNGGDDEYGGDFFISKLDADLTTLIGSTYLGGTDDEWCTAITVDAQGCPYITGFTGSDDYPTTAGAYDTTFAAGTGYINCDAIVAKLSADLTTLEASTLIGVKGNELGHGISIADSGKVFIMGYTASAGFPTTSGAFDRTYGGQCDGFVCRFDEDLTTLEASTFFGGNGMDHPIVIIAHEKGIIMPGYTESTDLPTTPGAYNTTYNGGMDGYVAIMDHDLTAVKACTYLGATGEDRANALAIDPNGKYFYVAGTTLSPDFPVTQGAIDTTHGGGPWGADAFSMKFDESLSESTLEADTDEISATTGGEVGFLLDAGADNGGRNYLLLGTTSGIEPGHPLPGGLATLPLNLDLFTYYFVFPHLNTSVFSQFMGLLDGQGQATAQLNAPALSPGEVGVEIQFAFCLNNPFDFASNAVEIQIAQ